MKDIGIVSSIISYNLFDDLKSILQTGYLDVHQWINETSIEFVEKFDCVKDGYWDVFCLANGYEDYEDVVLTFAKNKLK